MQQARKFDRCRCSHRCVQLRDHEILRWLQSKIESSNENGIALLRTFQSIRKQQADYRAVVKLGFIGFARGIIRQFLGAVGKKMLIGIVVCMAVYNKENL